MAHLASSSNEKEQRREQGEVTKDVLKCKLFREMKKSWQRFPFYRLELKFAIQLHDFLTAGESPPTPGGVELMEAVSVLILAHTELDFSTVDVLG